VPLDEDAQQLLAAMAARGEPPMETLTPAEARANTEAAAALTPYESAEVASVEERSVAGVPCLVVTPLGQGPWPVLVWFHGGGWVIGSATMSLHTARDLAAGAGCVVVSADYRLAPEHPFPAAHDDAVAVTREVLTSAAAFSGDAARVAVGGDSAGGNLAAVAALEVPGLVFQVLGYPVLDATMSQPSYGELAEGYILTASMMRWFVDLYVGDHDPKDPRISPLYAADDQLSATCPAHLVLAGYDPLRDEGAAYAARLSAAGVKTSVAHYEGQMHGLLSMVGALPTAAAAQSDVIDHLVRAFGGVGGSPSSARRER
jgi:acetyl esterase